MPWWILVAGLAAGFVSGLMGVGGGIVLTPLLHYGLGLAWQDAVATSLLVITLQAPVGVWRHARRRAVSWRTGTHLALGGLAGVYLGDRLLPRLPVPALKLLFALVMLGAAWRLATRAKPTTPPEHDPAAHPLPVLLAVGLGAGILSRLLGVGGGILTVPALGLLGLPAHLAVGSSLVPVFTNAAAATGANLARDLGWSLGLLLAAGAIPGTLLGARAAHALPEHHLRRVVATALALTALLVAATSGL